MKQAPDISGEREHEAVFLCQSSRSLGNLLRLCQNTGDSLAHLSCDFAAVATRGERDSRGMTKPLELARIRTRSNIDGPVADREHHRCRHSLSSFAERRQRDTLRSLQISQCCFL